MTTYVSVAELLQWACGFHREAAACYAGLARLSEGERTASLLEHVKRQAGRHAEGLARYPEERAADLLEAQIQYGPDPTPLAFPSANGRGPGIKLNEVEALALEAAERMHAFYDEAARRAEPERVKSLFQHLADQQKQYMTDLARDAAAMRQET